jgi:hypothetical protein
MGSRNDDANRPMSDETPKKTGGRSKTVKNAVRCEDWYSLSQAAEVGMKWDEFTSAKH